jgi:hypothetical protein
MAETLAHYIKADAELALSNGDLVAIRTGRRATLDDRPALAHLLGGQLPYYYRRRESIGRDFASGHNALDMVVDLVTKLPTKEAFRRSHTGEILASVFLEHLLGYRRLYSKLTMTTTEDENVHKMDGLFVRIDAAVAEFVAVEAKTSIQPTGRSRFSGHRYGILRALLDSLGSYDADDLRFDLTLARDQLESGSFTRDERELVTSELRPPGPDRLTYLGVATINESTVDAGDDDFVLTAECNRSFDYQCLTVPDLAALADAAYGTWDEVRGAADV